VLKAQHKKDKLVLVWLPTSINKALDLNYLGSEIPPPPLRTLTGVISSSVQEVKVNEEANATRRM